MKNIHLGILPGFLSLLSKIRYLNISSNNLENVEILENSCPNLIHLDLSHNLIKILKIKSEMLEYLDISSNKFTKIEDFSIQNHDNLIFLNSKNNPFDSYYSFNENLKQIISIYKKLQIFNNKILTQLPNNLTVLPNEVVIDHDKIYENSKFFQDIRINKETGTKSNN